MDLAFDIFTGDLTSTPRPTNLSLAARTGDRAPSSGDFISEDSPWICPYIVEQIF